MASYNNCLPEGLSKSPTIQKVTGLTKESSAIITKKRRKKKKEKFESEVKLHFFPPLEVNYDTHAKISK